MQAVLYNLMRKEGSEGERSFPRTSITIFSSLFAFNRGIKISIIQLVNYFEKLI